MKRKGIISMAAALAAASIMPMPVFAVDAFQYTAIHGTATKADMFTFNKYMLVEDNAPIPNATFRFSIAPGAAMPYNADDGTMEIKAGPAGAKICDPSAATAAATPFDIAFAPGNTTKNNTGADVLAARSTAGGKYATKPVAVDLSAVNFDAPGIYRYVITEALAPSMTRTDGYDMDTGRGSGAGVTQGTRYLDVYVIDDPTNAGTLKIDKYVLHETASAVTLNATNGSTGGNLADKSDGYINEYRTVNLTFTNDVYGNQASRDKFFKYDVTLSGLEPGASYVVKKTSVDGGVSFADSSNGPQTTGAVDKVPENGTPSTNTTYNNQNNPGTTLTADADGNITTTVYLQHGQGIQFLDLPIASGYTITETPEDYKLHTTIWDEDNAEGPHYKNGFEAEDSDIFNGREKTEDGGDITNLITMSSNGMSDTDMMKDTIVHFHNTRDGIVPTGLTLTMLPGLAIIAATTVGIAGIKGKKKEED